ncbi:MAG: hypothetical protein WED00_00950, partial [Aquisalimonadaceae bacterium]
MVVSANAGRAIVDAARPKRGLVEMINLRSTTRSEGNVRPLAKRFVAMDPQGRISIAPESQARCSGAGALRWHSKDQRQSERCQSYPTTMTLAGRRQLLWPVA